MQIARMTKAGRSAADISAALRITERQVVRIRKQLGIAKPVVPRITEQEWQLAHQMLLEGCSYGEVSRTLGRDHGAIQRRFPGFGWHTSRGAEQRELYRQLEGIGRAYGR